MVVLINRGGRTWHLYDGVEVDGKLVRRKRLEDGSWDSKEKVIKRTLLPGASIEAIDAEEAAQMLDYKNEIVDADKVVPQVADKVKALTDQVADLQSQIATFKERLAAYETPEEAPKKGGGKK